MAKRLACSDRRAIQNIHGDQLDDVDFGTFINQLSIYTSIADVRTNSSDRIQTRIDAIEILGRLSVSLIRFAVNYLNKTNHRKMLLSTIMNSGKQDTAWLVEWKRKERSIMSLDLAFFGFMNDAMDSTLQCRFDVHGISRTVRSRQFA